MSASAPLHPTMWCALRGPELDELWNFGIAWERSVVRAEKKEKGIAGYPTIPFQS